LKIRNIIWLDEFVDKLARKHCVDQSEVAEVLLGRPLFRFIEKGHRRGENVYSAMGKTRTGRFLTIFFVLKDRDRALILSARDMSARERKTYEKK